MRVHIKHNLQLVATIDMKKGRRKQLKRKRDEAEESADEDVIGASLAEEEEKEEVSDSGDLAPNVSKLVRFGFLVDGSKKFVPVGTLVKKSFAMRDCNLIQKGKTTYCFLKCDIPPVETN